MQGKKTKELRRGSRIIDDAPLSVEESDDSDDEPESRPVAIKWGVPSGFVLAEPPSKIDKE